MNVELNTHTTPAADVLLEGRRLTDEELEAILANTDSVTILTQSAEDLDPGETEEDSEDKAVDINVTVH